MEKKYDSLGLVEKCQQSTIPLYVVFELTPLCNFSCKMCYIHLDKENVSKRGGLLSKDEWINLGRDAAASGSLMMTLTGGEVFSRPDFLEIYTALHRLGFLITIRTNGYLINKEAIDVFTKYPPMGIGITLYGGSDEMYKRVCNVEGGFTKVTTNIVQLINNAIPTQLYMTVIKDNEADVSSVKSFAVQHKLKLKVSYGLFNPIRGAKRDINGLSVVGRITEDKIDSTQYRQPERSNIDSNPDGFSMCRAFGAKCAVTWDGDMLLCLTSGEPRESVKQKTFIETFRCLVEQGRQVKKPAECLNCKYADFCRACPSRFYSETGKLDKINKSICEEAMYNYLHFGIVKKKGLECEEDEQNED